MAIFRCKMCGGALEITEGRSVTVCEYCGTQQTLPKLDDDRRANMYDRANHFRRSNEYDKAMGIYEQILNEDNTDAEAYWSLVLCRYGIEYVEDPATKKRIPTVNRAQYTSVFDDANYRSALKYADMEQRIIYESEAETINEIQKGILTISQKEEPFDVFICYKETDNNGRRTQDSVLANDLYHQLTQEGFKVFFARITLEDKLGSAYEPYIFAALNSAKVMVVLGTRPEFFKAVWVKNEWSRYLSLIRQGQKKVLVPAYKDMDPYDLPEEFSHLQAQDMSRLGFMQDLIRGIKKIVRSEEPVSQRTTYAENAAISNTGVISPLLKRAFMFLEDEEWNSSNEYCEKVLDIDPECAEAYLCRFLASFKIKSLADFTAGKYYSPGFLESKDLEKVERFGDDAIKVRVEEGLSTSRLNYCKVMYEKALEKYKKGDTVEELQEAVNIFTELKDYKDSKDMVNRAKTRADDIKYKPKYDKAVDILSTATTDTCVTQARTIFEEIITYRDSKERLKECDKKSVEIKYNEIYNYAVQRMNVGVNFDAESNLKGAIESFSEIPGWRDSDVLKAKCEDRIEAIHKKDKRNNWITFFVVVGIILAMLSVVVIASRQ